MRRPRVFCVLTFVETFPAIEGAMVPSVELAGVRVIMGIEVVY